MKIFTITFLITLLYANSPAQVNLHALALNSVPASYSERADVKETKLDTALDAYLRGLKHDMPAIVESAMFNLLVLRIDYPTLDYSEAIEELKTLNISGSTSSVRYKAHVTLAYMQDPTLFLDVNPIDFNSYMDLEKADQFYLALSKVLQEQLTSNR